MTRRGKRLTLGVMAVGVAVVLVLAIAYPKPILDHVAAWRFQLTRGTQLITPLVGSKSLSELELFYYLLAHRSECPVIFDPAVNNAAFAEFPDNLTLQQCAADSQLLRTTGWRVLEQRFPRKAYVVIPDEQTRDAAPP